MCLATDTVKVLPFSGWTTAHSHERLQNTAHPQLNVALEMDGRVLVCVCVWANDGRVRREGGGVEMRNPVQSNPRVGRGLKTTTAASILSEQNKTDSLRTRGVWATQPAMGGEDWTGSLSTPLNRPLSSSPCLVLFVQPSRIMWSRAQTTLD